jgi:uncharacterized protein (DUF433 family)
MKLKQLIATVVTAGVVVVGTAGVASAATSPAPATQSNTKAHNHRGLRHRALRAGAKVAATTIGIDVKTLVSEVRSGKTVAEVAQSHNVDPQKVIDAVVTAGNTKIDQLVANGKLTAERAATIKSKLSVRVTKLVNETPHRAG